MDHSELGYEMVGALEAYNSQFVVAFYGGKDSQYCDSVKQVENVFGCIGLQNAKHCILNTQYTPEEYAELKEKLVEHMEETGEYGEFFPVTVSPFAYNETAAQDNFPLQKTDVESNDWRWRDVEDKDIKYSQYRIPDNIETVKDDVLENFLTCEQCKKSYKIVKRELELYRQTGAPLPHECFNCRHMNRLKQHNPRALWHRQCMCTQPKHDHSSERCSREFETSYSDKNPALVYCEECYQKELN